MERTDHSRALRTGYSACFEACSVFEPAERSRPCVFTSSLYFLPSPQYHCCFPFQSTLCRIHTRLRNAPLLCGGLARGKSLPRLCPTARSIPFLYTTRGTTR